MYEGKHKGGEVGGYDTYVMLAERYHWTPEQVDRLDPDYIDELLVRMSAEADVDLARREREKRKAKDKPGRAGTVEADIAEIV